MTAAAPGTITGQDVHHPHGMVTKDEVPLLPSTDCNAQGSNQASSTLQTLESFAKDV